MALRTAGDTVFAALVIFAEAAVQKEASTSQDESWEQRMDESRVDGWAVKSYSIPLFCMAAGPYSCFSWDERISPRSTVSCAHYQILPGRTVAVSVSSHIPGIFLGLEMSNLVA